MKGKMKIELIPIELINPSALGFIEYDVYKNGVRIIELGFTLGADGKIFSEKVCNSEWVKGEFTCKTQFGEYRAVLKACHRKEIKPSAPNFENTAEAFLCRD